MAQEAGADIITHAPMDEVMSEQEVRHEGRISVPTLTMMKRSVEKKNGDFENCRRTMTALHRAGVPVLAGTMPTKHQAYQQMLSMAFVCTRSWNFSHIADFSTVEAIRAATCLPARYFGLHDRGVTQPGYRADLVLLRENPIENIQATKSIERVWTAGQEFVCKRS